MPFIGDRLQIQAILISINQEISLRIVGYALGHRLILFLLNALVTRQILVLFSSSDTTRTIFFVLWKNPIAQSRVSPISLLVVGYEETCHAVTTLPFILRVFFFYLNIFF